MTTTAQHVLRRAARLLVGAAIGAMALVVLAVNGVSSTLFEGPLLLFAIASAVLIAGVLDARSPIARMLSTAPFVFLGRISYSLYLWHIPVLAAFGVWVGYARIGVLTVPAIVVAVAAATASYYLVELPFLRRKRALAHKADEPVGAFESTEAALAPQPVAGVG